MLRAEEGLSARAFKKHWQCSPMRGGLSLRSRVRVLTPVPRVGTLEVEARRMRKAEGSPCTRALKQSRRCFPTKGESLPPSRVAVFTPVRAVLTSEVEAAQSRCTRD